MKKVKVMLTAITVFAIVGGALAFKAQKFDLARVCSGSAIDNCPNWDIDMTTTTTGNEQVYYTTTLGTNCANAKCNVSTFLKKEG